MHAIVVRHYWNGTHYPVGGPSEIVHQLVRAIERHGGRVLVQAPVTEILCADSGTAIGECGRDSSRFIDLTMILHMDLTMVLHMDLTMVLHMDLTMTLQLDLSMDLHLRPWI